MTPPEETSSAKLARTDRELLIMVWQDMKTLRRELNERFDREEEEQKVVTETHKESFSDHEQRLRALENFRWWIIGATAVSGVVWPLIAKAVGLFKP